MSLNKDAKRLRDNYGVAYSTGLRLITELGLDGAIEKLEAGKGATMASCPDFGASFVIPVRHCPRCVKRGYRSVPDQRCAGQGFE